VLTAARRCHQQSRNCTRCCALVPCHSAARSQSVERQGDDGLL